MKQPILLLLTVFSLSSLAAQSQKDSTASEDAFFNKLVAYSRPATYHQLLATIAGSWTWKSGEHSGSLTRKPFAGGRFFIVESSSSKNEPLMQSPVQDGKMEVTTFQTHEVEGYDNVKNKFVKSLVNNHIGSFIASYEGRYDSVTKTIVFETEVAFAPDTKWKVYEHLIFIDKDHYKVENYRQQDNEAGKVNEAYYTRVKVK